MNDVVDYLRDLQRRLLVRLEQLDGKGKFVRDHWTRPGGEGLTAVLERGATFERAGASFSDISGTHLPPSATAVHPELAGRPVRAVGGSVVTHPLNPHAPTSHLNVRAFSTHDGAGWWFGGGYDLTPYYPYEEDARHSP